MNLPPVKWRAVSIHREEFIHWPAPICRARNRRDALVRVVASCLVLASLVLSRCSAAPLPADPRDRARRTISIAPFCFVLSQRSRGALVALAALALVSRRDFRRVVSPARLADRWMTIDRALLMSRDLWERNPAEPGDSSVVMRANRVSSSFMYIFI